MCKYLPKVHLHTESHQDRSRNKKVFSCVPYLLWNRPWSNEVSKMSLFKAGSRNFAARTLIFGYFIVLLILSKSYYWHFSIRPFICMWDGLKDAESVPPYCGLLLWMWRFFFNKCLKVVPLMYSDWQITLNLVFINCYNYGTHQIPDQIATNPYLANN